MANYKGIKINGIIYTPPPCSWSEVTDKPSTFSPSYHSHSWSEITSKPSTFTPSTHSHSFNGSGMGITYETSQTTSTVGSAYIELPRDNSTNVLICFGAFHNTNDTISFTRAFSRTPFILTSENPDSDMQAQRVAVSSASTTGFTTYSKGSNYPGRYIAIGVRNK